ncbi:Uncharacterized protein CTYZ_00003167 [Cryptosporidium tyzzeri]|nr:Uncharacterized protein CTYZ_00003167 [Cryptosporidium tyzzeri]
MMRLDFFILIIINSHIMMIFNFHKELIKKFV